MKTIRLSMGVVVVFSTSFSCYPIAFRVKPALINLIHFVPSRSTSIAVSPDYIAYGPSLLKGEAPFQLQSLSPNGVNIPAFDAADENNLFQEEQFTRVFEVSALRVRAKDCSFLESKIRGHLLNWPRIRNIARVPGDDVDEEVNRLFESKDAGDDVDMVALERRIYGRAEGDGAVLNSVLHRERLAKEFNARGFVNFRNLARISRPKKRASARKKEEPRRSKNDFAVVEVVGEENEGDDWKGLLGDEGRKNRWRGSTRLLLLDERYTYKAFEELPPAIKAALQEVADEHTSVIHELVKCRLTLHYDYWPMNEVLEALLPKDVTIPSSFESVGHIAHLNLKDELLSYKKVIAKVVLDKNKPKIQTVVNKTDVIHNEFRTMQLEVLAGNHSLVTMVVENGLRLHVDLANVFWNSRLATERQRITKCFARDDVVCDVFAGVGPISIAAAKIVKRVYANDLNPDAVDYLAKNCVENRLERKIKVFNMDGRRFISSMFESEKGLAISHVVMNLPSKAVDFLDVFRGLFGSSRSDASKLPRIHVYGFSKAEDPEYDFLERIRATLEEEKVDVTTHRVLLVSPGKWMLCASFVLPSSVAYAEVTTIAGT